MPPVVVFSPLDPSGGAGLQADILTLHSLGCHALAVSTGTTSQDADRLYSFAPAPPRSVREQFAGIARAAAGARAMKVGALGTPALARAVADVAAGLGRAKLVVDPVVVPTGGDRPFMAPATARAARRRLFPLAEVITPNGEEARALTGRGDPGDAAKDLIDGGCAHVLLSSLAQRGRTIDARLYGPSGVAGEWSFRRGPECHGTGCTLASAVAAGIAAGHPTPRAVDLALNFAYDSSLRAYGVRGLGKRRIPLRIGRGRIRT